MKICNICNQAHPESNFPTAGVKNGKRYSRLQCTQCYGKKKRHRRYVNKQWLKDLKETMACESCGYSKKTHSRFRTQALEFHHYEDNKKFEVSNGVHRGMAIKKLKEEIDKCKVLCSRCHVEEHYPS
jgi:hypothetical protein